MGSILHLEDRKLTYYAVPYDKFAERRAERWRRQNPKRQGKARIAHLQSYVDRFRYKASKAVQAQSRLKMIERIQPGLDPARGRPARVFLPRARGVVAPDHPDRRWRDTGYGETEVLKRLNLRIDQDDRIALVGQERSGQVDAVQTACRTACR